MFERSSAVAVLFAGVASLFPIPGLAADVSAEITNAALHAGLAYKVTPGLTVELAYSYVNMGNGLTGPSNSFDQVTNTTHAPFSFNNITSNDVMLGLRWELNSPPVYAPPPLIRKG